MTTGGWGDVEVVLFDWNGTLADDLERASGALEVVLRRRGLPSVGIDGFRQGFRLPLGRWLSALGIDDDDLVAAEDEWNAEMRSRPVHLQPGARQLLARLVDAGKRVGVVSAAATESVVSDLRETGVENLVDVVFGDSVDKVATLRRIVDGLRGSGVYVGDVEYDVEAGRTAGLLTIAFTGGYRPKAALQDTAPDALVDDLDRIAGLLGLVN